jgi:quercetin dioxygenase-like cupin family protein
MRTLVNDPVATDTISVTHVPVVPQTMHAQAGAELRWEARPDDHHLVVLRGTCNVFGRRIGAGGSAYIPAGVDHTVRAGAWGCTFYSVDTVTSTA